MKNAIFTAVVVSLLLTGCSQNAGIDPDKQQSATAQLSCTLTSDELVKREAALKGEIFSKVKKITELEDGYELEFKEDGAFAARLVEFINLERNCCSFFTFTLTFEPQGGPLKVKIGNSKEIKEMLKTELSDKHLIN